MFYNICTVQCQHYPYFSTCFYGLLLKCWYWQTGWVYNQLFLLLGSINVSDNWALYCFHKGYLKNGTKCICRERFLVKLYYKVILEGFFGRRICDLLVVLETKLSGSLGGLPILSLISYPVSSSSRKSFQSKHKLSSNLHSGQKSESWNPQKQLWWKRN